MDRNPVIFRFRIRLSFSIEKISNGSMIHQIVPSICIHDQHAQHVSAVISRRLKAIVIGCIHGDLLDDILCKYVNGAILCKIRDYRRYYPCKITGASYANSSPTIHNETLLMGMENVVKNMPSISNISWTYEDQLKAESWIIMTLQRNLCLNPKPMLDRLCKDPRPKKINLDIPCSWKKIS